jgi:hypothetical protein
MQATESDAKGTTNLIRSLSVIIRKDGLAQHSYQNLAIQNTPINRAVPKQFKVKVSRPPSSENKQPPAIV